AFSFERQTATLMDLYREPPAACEWDAAPPLIVCEGEHFSTKAYRAIDEFPTDIPVRFALADWFVDGFPANTRALWVVDPAANRSRVRQAMMRDIPVIFPAQHIGMSNLCADGLAYDSQDDVARILHRLTKARQRVSLPMSAPSPHA